VAVSNGDGLKPDRSADKSLGEIVTDVSDKATLLVREEIELAKAELITKAKRLGTGAAVGGAAGVFVLFALYMLLFAIGFVLVDIFGFEDTIWPGFLIGTGLFLVLAAIAGFLAYRFVQKGTPPTPELAIEEAKETRRAIEEVRR
jgi:uncharacterized membrane protein YqjE